MISVIMPVYNTCHVYLGDAIESVRNQTYKDFEFIIVDDGSNEETKRVLHEQFLKGGIKKIMTIPKNKGIGHARNAGILVSEGTHIAFLSSDDIWDFKFLQVMMENFTEGILFCDYDRLLTSGGVVKRQKTFEFPKKHEFDSRNFKNIILSNVRNHTIPVNYSCILGEKKYFEKENEFWDEATYGEDLHHLCKVYSKAKFTYLPESLVFYREHKDTTTNKHHNHIHENNEKIFKKLREEGINISKEALKMEKVTVVIPTYNRRQIVTKAINSVLEQTYKGEIEIIVVDDGSNDGTARAILPIMKKHNNVHYYYKDNGGCASALNYGFQRASGSLICWLSSDDWYEPEFIEESVKAHKDKNIGMTYSNYYIVQKAGKRVYESYQPGGPKDAIKKLNEVCFINGSTIMVKKEVFYDIGFFNEAFRYAQDYDFFMRVLHNYKVKLITKPLVNYADAAENPNDPEWLGKEVFSGKHTNEGEPVRERYKLMFEPGRQKVGAILVMKNEEELLPQCLNDLIMYIDEIFILDDGSTDRSVEIAEKYSKVKKILRNPPKGNKRNEGKDRQRLLKEAQKSDCGWLLMCDSITPDRHIPVKIGNNIDVYSVEELFEMFEYKGVHNLKDKEVIFINDNNVQTLSCNRIQQFDINAPIFINRLIGKQRRIAELLLDGKDITAIAKELKTFPCKIKATIRTIKERFKKRPLIQGEWKPIKQIIRHETKKDIYELKQKQGITKITKDHSLMVIDNGNLRKGTIKELNKKIYVPKIDIINKIPTTKQEIDLSKYLENINHDSKHIWKKIKINSKRKINNFKRILKNKDLEMFCELIGAYIAEGSCTDRDFSISCSDKKWINKLHNNLKSLFDGKIRITKDNSIGFKRRKCIYHLRCSDKILRDIFIQLCGRRQEVRKIPSFVYSLNEKYSDIVLKNMLLGDGSAYMLKNKKERYTYTTVSLKLISGLSMLLRIKNVNYTINTKDLPNRLRAYCVIINSSAKEKINNNVRITKLKQDYDYVYDLEVENNHTFVDACGLLLLHNSDEVMEDCFKTEIWKEIKDKEMNMYHYQSFNFWRDRQHYRIDEMWFKGWFAKLFRNIKGLKYNTKENEHCGSVPCNIPGAPQWFNPQQSKRAKLSSVRIKHYGYADWNRVEMKYRNLMERDYNPPEGRHARYDRMVTEKGIDFGTWEERPYYLKEGVEAEKREEAPVKSIPHMEEMALPKEEASPKPQLLQKRVLFVGEGNNCRSLFAQLIAEKAGFDADSAGTRPQNIARIIKEKCVEYGLDMRTFSIDHISKKSRKDYDIIVALDKGLGAYIDSFEGEKVVWDIEKPLSMHSEVLNGLINLIKKKVGEIK